jgi:hypothetical protein
MSEIYRNASKVLVCMGRDTDGGAEDVASLVHDVSQMISKYNSIAEMPVLHVSDPLYDDPRWKSVATLHRLPWWTRAWVVQEVGLAKDPQVLYGPVEFAYRDLMKLAAWTMRRAPNLEIRAGVSFFSIHVDWADWSDDWRTTATYPGNNLVDLLNQARWLGCSNPRDHIYSLLGHPLATLDAEKTPIAEPDYDRDHMDVWYDLAERLIKSHGLAIVSAVEHSQEELVGGYPSWVPWCWEDEYTSCTLGCYYDFYYRADGGLSASPSGKGLTTDEFRQLHAEGVSVDVIKDTVKFNADDLAASPEKLRSMASSPGIGSSSQLALRSIWEHARELGQSGATVYGDQWLTAFSLTLIAGITTYDCAEDDIERHKRDFRAYFKLWIEANYEKDSPEMEPFLSAMQESKEGEPGDDMGDAERYYIDLKLMCEGRSFLFTEKGFFGLSLCIAQPGDKICVLFGSKCPFVLREWDVDAEGRKRHKLVQDSFVHGIMRGEAMKSFESGTAKEESFIIC